MVIILNSQVFQTTHTAQSYTRLHLNKHYLEKKCSENRYTIKMGDFLFCGGLLQEIEIIELFFVFDSI